MKLNKGILVIIVILVVLDIVIGVIGYQIWVKYEENSFHSSVGRDLGLQCGSDDHYRGEDRGDRILCNPRVGAGGH